VGFVAFPSFCKLPNSPFGFWKKREKESPSGAKLKPSARVLRGPLAALQVAAAAGAAALSQEARGCGDC